MGDFQDLKEKHRRLFEQATSPQSVDVGRGAIFIFDKYCKHCGAGLVKPKPYCKRGERVLFNKSYCTQKCKDLGPTNEAKQKVRESRSSKKTVHPMERVAFCAVKIKKASLNDLEKLVLFAESKFCLLSEKLSWMEVQTGERFYKTKFYRVLKRIRKRIKD